MMLVACQSCGNLVSHGTCECPHCGRRQGCATALSPAAALMGLVLSACSTATPIYGVADTALAVDGDGDGWPRPDECDDDDATIHPGAEETPGDGIDSNCNGEDDT